MRSNPLPHRGIIFGVVLALAHPVAHASRDGAAAGLNGSPASTGTSCTLCHGGQSGSGSVQILGAPLGYRPAVEYDLSVRIADAAQAGAGFQISAEDPQGNHLGTLIVTNANRTQLDEGWITHTGDGVDDSVDAWASMGNAYEYQLRWRAPASDVGPVTFYAAGNAINDNDNPSGDHVYLTTATAAYCPADTDGNGSVDVDDLVAVILDWGTNGSGGNSDVDGSGAVDVDDLVQIILAWGAC